ncbi:MAG: twin-arginine translocation signal domain-containing protein [Spartobacteria bacterium]|nr:twin-arginine translocation signal domain-containing protein [Spartobacteria bacterium]
MSKRRRNKAEGWALSRRDFLRMAGAAAVAAGTVGCPAVVRSSGKRKKIIVLGIDGMDPRLLIKYMEQGRMPNCKRLMAMGRFSPIATSDPPQSPVAWSNFISGTNPGGHGIFDFIARDAETLKPYLSTSKTEAPAKTLQVGKYSIPVSAAKTELLRKGPTLWNLLQDAGIESTAFRVPVNFPPSPSSARTLAGITTPDIHGSYGIFSFYTDSPEHRPGDVAGGHIERLQVYNDHADCMLRGPANSFRTDGAETDLPISLDVDRPKRAAYIRIQDNALLLREGEWSDWVTLKFSMLPMLVDVSGICRFYLKRVDPFVELYVTPINIDPADPTMPICTPGGYARELVDEVGLFYTQGMPQDTAALSAKVFNDDDFRNQATFILEERMRFFDYELNNYKDGFLYFYFSSLDLDSHAFWRAIDPGHPLYTPALAAEYGDFIPWLYSRMDQAVGKAMQLLDEHTLMYVVSDHGFVSFRRQFNLNSWLMDNGYARPKNRFDRGHGNFFSNTDWPATQAYGLGINSMYLNIKGREPDGVVAPGEEADALKERLAQQLKAVIDPETGLQVITNVYRPEEIYSGPYVDMAPDLTVCYNMHYRASWDTILGKYPKEILLDNLDPWSGDHCMDSQFLPGVLLSNKPWAVQSPTLADMAPTILNHCGLPVPPQMTGRDLMDTHV